MEIGEQMNFVFSKGVNMTTLNHLIEIIIFKYSILYEVYSYYILNYGYLDFFMLLIITHIYKVKLNYKLDNIPTTKQRRQNKIS